MTYEDARLDVVRSAQTWDEVLAGWLELDRAMGWFRRHRLVLTPDEVFGSPRFKRWPPPRFGDIDAPLDHVERLVDLGRATKWAMDWRLVAMEQR